MKKFFTLLAACVLVLSADAQVKNAPVAMTAAPSGGAIETLVARSGAAKAPQKKIAMETGERIAGYYDTDYLPELTGDGYGGLMAPATGEIKAVDVFEPDMIKKFVGGQITKIRFALADSETTVSNAFVMEIDGYNNLSGYTNVVSEEDLSSYTPCVGWNDVTLTTPVTIQEGKYYVIGFQYTQTSSNYPLVTDEDFDDGFYSSTYGFLLYMTTSQYGLDWYNFDEQGHLCIQAVVKGGDFPEYDITLNNLTMDKYALIGSELNYSYDIRNYGEEMPTSYTIKVAVDGEVVDTLADPVELASSYQTISGTYAVPADMEATADGHTLKVYVGQINGETPTAGTADDELEGTFVVYDKSVDRQMHLVEEFTSVQCTYCPLGHQTLAKLEENHPGKYAVVAHHSLGMGSDPYVVSEDLGMQYVASTMDYIEYFLSITALPMASFDRAILNDDNIPGSSSISFEVGYSADYQDLAAELFDAAVDNYCSTVPAFLPVNIDATYSSSTRMLTVKVSGTGVDIAKDLLGDDVLNVFLLEDSIIGYQDGASSTYVHNNILRRTLSYCYGDDIDWDWNSSSSYENNYSVILDSDWKPWNMKVVAFISGPMLRQVGTSAYWTSQETAYVNNCNMFDLSTITGISAIASDGTNAAETARYAVDGTRLAAPAKGVNIVKMSDGSVKKVVVK